MSIGRNCTALESLKAAYCKEVITNRVILLMANTCKELNTLNISHCKTITEDGIEGFINNKQKFIALLLNGLEYIAELGVIGLIRNSIETLEHLELGFLDPVIL